MKNWREIKTDIENALKLYAPVVSYHKSTSSECGYFEVKISQPFDWEDVDILLKPLCKRWELQIDDDSHGSFNLNAYWDDCNCKK